MEFGPRALGNRSIICNPGMLNARSELNEKIKLRETFRPFAGSVLESHKNEWFECPTNEISPFMSNDNFWKLCYLNWMFLYLKLNHFVHRHLIYMYPHK